MSNRKFLRTTTPEPAKPQRTATKPVIDKPQGPGNEESNCEGQRSVLAWVLAPGYSQKSNSHGHQSIDGGKRKESSSSQGQRSTLADVTAPGYTDTEYSRLRTTKPETAKPQGTGHQWSGGGTSKGASNSHEQRPTLAHMLAPGYSQKYAKPH